MANFIAVVDPDADRRTLFIRTVRPLLPPVEGLVSGACEHGNFCAVWAAAQSAPISQVSDADGAAVIWGEAIPGSSSQRIDARKLKQEWRRPTEDTAPTYDGFYAAVVYHPGEGMVVGADILGIFPIYYYASGDVLLVGSSPELFRHHPCFRIQFNPAGLVGMLLTMHLLDGQTLLQGVKRLASGHLLLARDGRETTELQHYRIPVTAKYLELPLSAHVDILDGVFNKVVERHASAGCRHSLLLSGGLDSRMLGGYLRRNGIEDVVALTMGLPSDLEMKCATPVARALSFQHRPIDISYDQYPHCANLQARWEHGSSGFNCITNWGLSRHLSGLSDRVVMGYAIDTIVSEPVGFTNSRTRDNVCWDNFFAYHNGWGIQVETLRKLLRREVFDGLIEDTVGKMKRKYDDYAELDYHKAWCFDLNHLARFHVGCIAWAVSFGAWPVLPALDRSLVEAAAGMPPVSLWERRAQKELLCTRFPALAALPLDRNSWNTAPLQPSYRWRVKNYLRRRIEGTFARKNHPGSYGGGNNKGTERRYYYRVYDINGEGWRAVRSQAEPYRERVLDIFDKEVLDLVLPPPEAPLHLKDGIIHASGLKSLLGFLHWSREYLG